MAEKLVAAVETGLLVDLAAHGFTVVESDSSYRGSSVTVANKHARIVVTADWLEGEVTVEVGRLGEAVVPLDSVVDTKGLVLSRLSRSVTRGQLENRLRSVGERLIGQAPWLLDPG